MSEPEATATRIDGRYQVGRRLGEGAFGAVYLCEDMELHRQVAVKVLHPGKAKGQMLSRFRREAQAAAMLNHPNVVTVYDQGVTRGGEPYLVTEYIQGETLSDYLKREGPPPQALARRWIRQLGEALATAHAAGVIHRDVKPANVLLDGEDAKLADFGLARVEDDMTRMTETGQIMGTPIYMAPEVFLGEDADERADIYSLAAIAYRVLYGKRWRTGGLDTLIEEARNAVAPPEERFGDHPELDPTLRWGLQPRPEHRAPNAEAFLEAFMGQEEPPPPPQPEAPSWRRPATFAGLALVLLVVLGWATAPDAVSRHQQDVGGPAAGDPPEARHKPEPPRLTRAREALQVASDEVWGPGGRPGGYKERALALVDGFLVPTMPLRYRRLLAETEAAAREGADIRKAARTLHVVAERWWKVENGLQDAILERAYEARVRRVDVAAWKKVTGELQDFSRRALASMEDLPGDDSTLLWVRLSVARLLDGPQAGKVALRVAAHLAAAPVEVAPLLSDSLSGAVEAGNTTSRLGPDGDLAVITWLGRTLPSITGREPAEPWARVAGDGLFCAARVMRRRLMFTPPEGLIAFDRLLETLWSFRQAAPEEVRRGLKRAYIRLRGRGMIDDQEQGEASVRTWIMAEKLKELGDDPAEW